MPIGTPENGTSLGTPRRRTRSWRLTRCVHSVARLQLTQWRHASCRRQSDVTCERQDSTSASKNVDCTPLDWAMRDTALCFVISGDIFIKLTPNARLHMGVQSRVRLAGAHIFTWHSNASTTPRIAQPNSETHFSQSSTLSSTSLVDPPLAFQPESFCHKLNEAERLLADFGPDRYMHPEWH